MSNSIIKINTENFNSNINLDIPIMNKESTPVETIKYAPETAYWDKSSNVETLDLGLDSNFQEITLIKTDLEYNELVDSRISELENEITIYNSALDILDEELIRLRDIKTTVENSNTKTVATDQNGGIGLVDPEDYAATAIENLASIPEACQDALDKITTYLNSNDILLNEASQNAVLNLISNVKNIINTGIVACCDHIRTSLENQRTNLENLTEADNNINK